MIKRIIGKYFYLGSDNFKFYNWSNKFKIKNKTLRKELLNFEIFNLHYTNQDACGPLQKDEAIFIFSLIKCIQPKVVLEFGFNKGHSALCILSALSSSSTFFTNDISLESKHLYDTYLGKRFSNSKFINGEMQKIDFSYYFKEREIDLVFFDAVHDFDVNVYTYKNLKKYLSDECLILIHDTGLWNESQIGEAQRRILPIINFKEMRPGLIAHQIDERRFVNFLICNERFSVFNIHSLNVMRHGISILHKQSQALEV